MDAQGHILLVNPWIYDLAAFNLWIEPLGLLTIAAALRDSGYAVTLVDCLAPHPGMPPPRPDGSGKLLKTYLPKPPALSFVPRRYGRYGLPLDHFDAALAAAPRPDLVLVASGMTYWYPGVVEAIRRVRARFAAVPVALGGVYATLCPDHARAHSGADEVIAGPGVVAALRLADAVTGGDSRPDRYADPRRGPQPARDLAPRPYAAVQTSWGCPYRCTYCAAARLHPRLVRRPPLAVVDDVAACARRGVRDVAFYDDALLLDAPHHLAPILEALLALGVRVRYHTPNGLHAGALTADLAVLLRRAGFATIRLALETADPDRQQATGGKVTTAAFEQAVAHLAAAGFRPADVAAYVLAGLPGQPLSEVEATLRAVHRLGVRAQIALYSPIPGTPDGDRALPPGADPLLHNPTVYPHLLGPAYARDLQRLQLLAKAGNQEARGHEWPAPEGRKP